jgi:hypothetical protein
MRCIPAHVCDADDSEFPMCSWLTLGILFALAETKPSTLLAATTAMLALADTPNLHLMFDSVAVVVSVIVGVPVTTATLLFAVLTLDTMRLAIVPSLASITTLVTARCCVKNTSVTKQIPNAFLSAGINDNAVVDVNNCTALVMFDAPKTIGIGDHPDAPALQTA